MAAIILYEHGQLHKIEAEHAGIREARRHLTVLATLGESVISWDGEDSCAYRAQRLRLDSLLLTLRRECVRFVRPEQVDTLRILLAAKESHLPDTMRSRRQQKTA